MAFSELKRICMSKYAIKGKYNILFKLYNL